MVHKTKGIVLRTIKYGETSVICTVFTELLGLQSYIIKGVRSSGKHGRPRANALFPSSILQMVVIHRPSHDLNHVRECYPEVIYQTIQEDVVKNCVALFTVEVFQQILVNHDPQPELFSFLEDFLLQLDAAYTDQVANFPLFLLIQSARLAGYFISGLYSATTPFADIYDGRFSTEASRFPPFITGEEAKLMSDLNQAATLPEIGAIKVTGTERKTALQNYLAFMELHIPHFKPLKSLPVLTSILY